MKIRPEHLLKFKKPFGELIKDEDVTRERISMSVQHASGKVISVGDATTRRLVKEYGIVPDLAIIDGMEQRGKSAAVPAYPASQVRCSNPAGTISNKAVNAVRSALASRSATRILVDGEEDLLVLPVCVYAPLNSVVFYGQPGRGLVEVKITAKKKSESMQFLAELTEGPHNGETVKDDNNEQGNRGRQTSLRIGSSLRRSRPSSRKVHSGRHGN